MRPQCSLGVRLLGVLVMEICSVGKEELVSREKIIMSSALNILSSLCPWGYLGRVFYVLEMHTFSPGILLIADVPGVVQLTVPSSSLCSKRQTWETDSVTLIS